ncbi:MAG: SDR family oxidoreductase [Fuerstiella sp.]|nr:SDR family oxidoreductase [Fuerstiella sp.]
MSDVLIVGATSAIAQAVAQQYAAEGGRLFLVARNAANLDVIADDLRVRGAAEVSTLAADLTEHDRHPEIVTAACDVLPELDVVLVAHGVLPDQEACEASVDASLDSMDVNFLSVVSLLTPLANRLAEQGNATIAVISSVAGDRGRQSNYVYGAAKAGLDAFLQGLRNRLSKSGVHVLTIKPGFVTTPMTAHIENRGGPLWATPEKVAEGIVTAVGKQKDVVYLPSFWALIMLIIRNIPEKIFKKLSL